MADQMGFRVTPEQVETARSRLAEAGFPISGDSGETERGGYRIGYALTDGVLHLEALAKQRFVSVSAREGQNSFSAGGTWISEDGEAVQMTLRSKPAPASYKA